MKTEFLVQAEANDQDALLELSELQLALVGGGIGETILVAPSK